MVGSKGGMRQEHLCANFIFNIKLFVFQAFKNTSSYGESVKENNFIVSGMETLKELWLLNKITALNLPERLTSSLIPLKENI